MNRDLTNLNFTEHDLDELENVLSDNEADNRTFERIQAERERRHSASMAIKPVWEAAESGNLEFLQTLGVGSPRVNARDIDGFTPASHAVSHGQLEAFKLLINKRANLHLGDMFGGSPLASVVRWCEEGRFFGSDADPHAFLTAAAHIFAQKESSLKALVMVVQRTRCIDLRCRYYQRTPTHYAAVANNVPALQVLIDAWADLSMKDNQGKTALQCAKGNATALLQGAAEERRFSVVQPFVLYHCHQISGHSSSHKSCTHRANLAPSVGGQVRKGIEIWSQLNSLTGSLVLEFLLGKHVCIKRTWLQEHVVEVASLTQEVARLQSRIEDLEQALERERQTFCWFKKQSSLMGTALSTVFQHPNSWNCWTFCRWVAGH